MKLAISIVTANRPQHIEEDLEVIAQATLEYGIGIYIFDGSDNDQTQKAVNSYIDKGYDHIRYFYYEGGNINQRIVDAFALPQTKYIWLCGDKFLILPNMYPKIMEYINADYDVITMYDGAYKETRDFVSAVEYIKYCIVPLTHWGSTIIRKTLLEGVDIKRYREKIGSFWHINMYMEALSLDQIRGVALYEKKLKHQSKYQTESDGVHHMWSIWIEGWYKGIMNCPDNYAEIRKSILNLPDKQLGFFHLKELVRQRAENQFDIRKCMEYRRYITDVIVMPNCIVYIVSLLPQRMAKMLNYLWMVGVRSLCRIWHKIKGK